MSNDVEGLLLPLGRAATPGGLPYPTSQGLVADTDLYIRELSDAIDYRLDRRAIVMTAQALTSNSGGDMSITFPQFVTLQGCVLQPFAGSGSGSADIWFLIPRLTGLPNNTATVHVDYLPLRGTGYQPAPFGGTITYNVFAWGVPK